MAKGRKLTAGRSERLLGSYCQSQGQGTVPEASELGEEDVWATVDSMVNGGGADHSFGEWGALATRESNGRLNIRSRRREDSQHVGGLSLAVDHSGKTASSRIVHQFRGQDHTAAPSSRQMATSAPVNVPDWSKIYRVDSVESYDSDDDYHHFEMVPPHEYLAREYARNRMTAANSVFEGVGRTLKGRDMSRVRDAVWSQTGFDG